MQTPSSYASSEQLHNTGAPAQRLSTYADSEHLRELWTLTQSLSIYTTPDVCYLFITRILSGIINKNLCTLVSLELPIPVARKPQSIVLEPARNVSQLYALFIKIGGIIMNYDDKSSFIRVRALVSGRVQHVGYRYWAYEHAERLGLTGSVENLPDGRVEVVFQGVPECVNEMKEKLRQGPSMAIVRQIIFYRERVKDDETYFGPVY